MEDLARQTGAAVVFPQYTAAPEEQYPIQFEESYAVLRHVVEQGARLHLKSGNIALAGDSAGGHMAIAMVQLAQQRRLPVQISHLTLFYPVTDTHEKSSTYQTFRDGPYITERTLDWMVDAFLPNPQDRCNALTSPLSFASDRQLSLFPPTTLFVSGADPLIEEGEAFGHRLQKAGVETTILKADGQIHDYVMLEAVRKSPTARAVVELATSRLKHALRG